MDKAIKAQMIKDGFELRDCTTVHRPLDEDTSDFNYLIVHKSLPQITYIKPALKSIWFTFEDGTYKEYINVVLGYGSSEKRAWDNAEMSWKCFTRDEILSLIKSDED